MFIISTILVLIVSVVSGQYFGGFGNNFYGGGFGGYRYWNNYYGGGGYGNRYNPYFNNYYPYYNNYYPNYYGNGLGEPINF